MLNLTGSRTLFISPSLRQRSYAMDLKHHIPELVSRSLVPGELRVEGVPSLRDIVLVDNATNMATSRKGYSPWRDVHGSLLGTHDFRNILAWDLGRQDLRVGPLDRHDVINLQFTR